LIGIALGSLNTVVGVKKGPNAEIVLTSTSKRQLPSMVTYAEKDRVFGEASKEISKSNYQKTISCPRRYLGIQPDWDFVAEELKHSLAIPTLDQTTQRIAFQIDFKGKQNLYYPENVMGTFLNKLKHQWLNQGHKTKDVCVSVPDYYTCNERVAMIDAVALGKLNLISLINESSAIGLNYGLFRRAQLDEKNMRIVAFVDMGHCDTKIIYGQFNRHHQKIVHVTHDRLCGARDLDYLLMEYLSNIFQKKHGSNPMNNPKCKLRMLDFITKGRKLLTVNQETNIHIECLMDDEDLDVHLTKTDLEKLILPLVNKFKDILIKSLAEAKIELSDIHSVEMVGDAIRTPILQDAIKDVYKMEISKTLAPDECLAKGVTLFAAMSSPFFVLKDYTFEHYNNFTILLEYPFVKDGKVQIRSHGIIKKGDVFPSRKSIKFTEKQVPSDAVIQVRLMYKQEEVPFMKNTVLTTYSLGMPVGLKEEKFEFVLQFNMDINGIPLIDKATVNEIWYEDAAVDDKKDDKKNDDKKNDDKKNDDKKKDDKKDNKDTKETKMEVDDEKNAKKTNKKRKT
jgi:heat shock protein 4